MSELQPNQNFGKDDSPSQAREPIDPTGALSPPQPPTGYTLPPYPPPTEPAKRGGWLSRIMTGFLSSLLLISILFNLYFGIIFISMTRGPSESVYQEGDRKNRIVILPISGTIDGDTAEFVHEALAKLEKDPPKAIVLRVNSGGGGVSASDLIWHELGEFKKKHDIPIVASFGSIAASGGYYISMPSDHIFAEPTTITGSIGVIAQAFTVHELLAKIGVTPEIIHSTEAVKKDQLNPMRPWTDEDRSRLRSILDEAQERFVDIVHQGRKQDLNLEQVRLLATGDVFTSRQAQENKLVDSQGYLDAAIDKAKELAKIAAEVKPLVTQLSPGGGFGLFSQFSTKPPRLEQIGAQQVRRWLNDLGTPGLEYRWTGQ